MTSKEACIQSAVFTGDACSTWRPFVFHALLRVISTEKWPYWGSGLLGSEDLSYEAEGHMPISGLIGTWLCRKSEIPRKKAH